MPEINLKNTLSIIAESIPGNVAIIKPDGYIFIVNQNWIDFAQTNGIEEDCIWQEKNYYTICELANGSEKDNANEVIQGIRNLLNNIISNVFIEYPCHSPTLKQWFELRANLIEIDGKTFICLIHFNITERVTAQKKLQESQKMFRVISENAPFGIAMSKGNKRYYANTKLLNYLEYDNFQEYINTPLFDNVHPEDRYILEEKLKLIEENKIRYPINTKARCITTKGKIRFFSFDIYQVKINNTKCNLVNIVDETEKLITERSEKQLVIDSLYLNRKQEILESFTQFIQGIQDKYNFSENDTNSFLDIKKQFKFQANDWNLMKTHFRLIHKDFFINLSHKYPSLTQLDLNFCAMLKLNFSTKEIARYLNVKVTSVQRRKVRLKKKLNLSEQDKLIPFIQSL